MVSPRLADMLVRQIQSELTAHQNYMGISIYFERGALKGWGKLFHEQALEEAQHAAKIIRFLLDNDVEFDLPGLGPATTHYEDARAAVQSAAASERRVTTEFQAMAEAASDEKDFRTFQFLQWFIEEQVEEEAKMKDLTDLIDSGINLFQAEGVLSQLEGE